MFQMSKRQMAIQRLLSTTTKNQLQLVALLMKGNQRLVLQLFLTFRVFERTSKSSFLLQKRKFSFIGAHMPN